MNIREKGSRPVDSSLLSIPTGALEHTVSTLPAAYSGFIVQRVALPAAYFGNGRPIPSARRETSCYSSHSKHHDEEAGGKEEDVLAPRSYQGDSDKHQCQAKSHYPNTYVLLAVGSAHLDPHSRLARFGKPYRNCDGMRQVLWCSTGMHAFDRFFRLENTS